MMKGHPQLGLNIITPAQSHESHQSQAQLVVGWGPKDRDYVPADVAEKALGNLPPMGQRRF